MREATLETDRSFCPEGESAEPSGPWKPWVVRAIEISAPAGRTAQPAGVTRPRLDAAPAVAGGSAASASVSAASTREAGRFIERSQTPERGIRRGEADGIRP